ncbi:hypothetical protein H2200_000553 [Cladophialophora chaetospira]|uniref:Uncharacterized protein n=1 Tax=Cladophialophora chaetospira TaxID=386627 RepID=A0AA38XNN7_9EURO|nr:hypothetical protein H2200_000553 [Cladophialophora chaetospira]
MSFLLREEYTVELASREGAEIAEKWAKGQTKSREHPGLRSRGNSLNSQPSTGSLTSHINRGIDITCQGGEPKQIAARKRMAMGMRSADPGQDSQPFMELHSFGPYGVVRFCPFHRTMEELSSELFRSHQEWTGLCFLGLPHCWRRRQRYLHGLARGVDSVRHRTSSS